MPITLLPVSHFQQRTQADCLPVCAQMVLTCLGQPRSYKQLIDILGTRWFGTPFRHLQRLEKFGLSVMINELSIVEITNYIKAGSPVIAYMHTADLSYWTQAADHVVVVTGVDDENIYVNDPSLSEASQAVPRIEFELAQLRYDNLCAVITIQS